MLGKVFMKDILSAYRKRLRKSLAVLVIVAVALLLARGEGRLAFAFLLGLVAALVFVWNMAFRLWNLSTDAKTAHRQMLWGMFLRLAVLALVLLAAALASSEVMWGREVEVICMKSVFAKQCSSPALPSTGRHSR